MTILQVPSIILPTVHPLGTEMETVNDLVTHVSTEFEVGFIQEKILELIATEIVVVGVPGALWAWVELSPVPTTISGAYWKAIGGGGGALAPIAPTIIAAIGVNLTVHTFPIPWTMHSAWARLVVQVPVAAAPATAFWLVQGLVSGKG